MVADASAAGLVPRVTFPPGRAKLPANPVPKAAADLGELVRQEERILAHLYHGVRGTPLMCDGSCGSL